MKTKRESAPREAISLMMVQKELAYTAYANKQIQIKVAAIKLLLDTAKNESAWRETYCQIKKYSNLYGAQFEE